MSTYNFFLLFVVTRINHDRNYDDGNIKMFYLILKINININDFHKVPTTIIMYLV